MPSFYSLPFVSCPLSRCSSYHGELGLLKYFVQSPKKINQLVHTIYYLAKMQIKTIRSALISNYEVLQLLEESQEAQKQVQKVDPSVEYPEHLRTIQFELTEYLKETPCSTQSPEQLANFLELMSRYELTRAEKLQILNLRPKSTVEIYLIIEECEERFSEEDLEEMLNNIITSLPRDDDYEEEEEEEGEGEGEGEVDEDAMDEEE
ncbi:unnamed protein product [Mucor hiemalis]